MKVNIGKYRKGDKKRKIKVELDEFDTWSADHTLALIIHPVLIQLKETAHGAPNVDNEDVPEHLHRPDDYPSYDTDENHFKRWEFVIDEMIWAFGEIIKDDDSEFYTGEADFNFIPIEGSDCFEMVKGENHTLEVDNDGLKEYHNRILRGTTLFGKYFRSLWD